MSETVVPLANAPVTVPPVRMVTELDELGTKVAPLVPLIRLTASAPARVVVPLTVSLSYLPEFAASWNELEAVVPPRSMASVPVEAWV